MNRTQRIEAIKEVEDKLQCRLLVLFYNSLNPALASQLALDFLPQLRTTLVALKMEDDKPLAVFINSNGGVLDSPWPIASSLRAALKKKNDLWFVVDDKAHSAATLLALAGDKILMSPYASLSPVDPQLNLNTAPNVKIGAGIEDIKGYYALLKELFPTDDAARAQAFALLAQRIPPEILGQVQRTHSYIRMLVKKLLSLRKKKSTDSHEKLVKALTEEYFSHNYRLYFPECKSLNLPVALLSDDELPVVEKLTNGYIEAMGRGDLTVNIPEGQNEAKLTKQRAFLETNNSAYIFTSEFIVNRNQTAQVNDLGWRKED